MKVKVRVNIHGIFTVSSASLVEKVEKEEGDNKEEAMEVDEAAMNNKEATENNTENNTEAKPSPEKQAENGPKTDEKTTDEVGYYIGSL